MKRQFDEILARFGQSAAVTRAASGESETGRAFVEPILAKREDAPVAATALGAVSEQRWLYLGRGDVPLFPGDRVTCGGAKLTVQEARPVYWEDEIAYVWALLRPEREAAE